MFLRFPLRNRLCQVPCRVGSVWNLLPCLYGRMHRISSDLRRQALETASYWPGKRLGLGVLSASATAHGDISEVIAFGLLGS